MPLKEEPYKFNQGILKNYGGLKYKLIHFKVLRTSGLELPEKTNGITLERGEANEEKLENNISRAKATVLELAMCNPWEYWMTLTLDPKKYDRTNLQGFRKDFTQWLRDQKKKLGCEIKYLLVPELHADGKSWHMHGFISGLPIDQLRLFDVKEKLPSYIIKKRHLGHEVYDWLTYRSKFGFVDVEPIRSRDACSKYVTKYISKELDKTIQDLEANLYYCSQGLQRAEVMKKGTMVADLVPDFENDYVRIQWFDANQDLASLKSMIIEPVNNFKPRQLRISSLLR